MKNVCLKGEKKMKNRSARSKKRGRAAPGPFVGVKAALSPGKESLRRAGERESSGRNGVFIGE